MLQGSFVPDPSKVAKNAPVMPWDTRRAAAWPWGEFQMVISVPEPPFWVFWRRQILEVFALLMAFGKLLESLLQAF